MNRGRWMPGERAIAIAAGLAIAACGTTDEAPYAPPAIEGTEAGADGAIPATDGGGAVDGSIATSDAGVLGEAGAVASCATRFTYVPAPGRLVHSVAVSGEWNGFDPAGVAMTGPDARGAWTVDVPALAAGLVGYKVVVDGSFELDPGSPMRKYVGGVENSAVEVPDCQLPQLSVLDHATSRPSAGAGRFTAHVQYTDGNGASGIDLATLAATLVSDTASTPLAAPAFDAATWTIAVDVPQLADGKYTVLLDAKDHAGHVAKTLRLVFWIEAEPFDWRDAVLYMAMTDRFQDGDPTNDPAPTSGVDPRADYKGGDLQGIKARIDDGTFDQLGVRALWLSPFHVNPPDKWGADDGVHEVMGYHGYWPIKARAVDPRIGGEAALHALVAAAHAHGIRVLQDFVVNHVHQEHEYYAQHPEWFRTGCVCGTANCDWTTHRLDCMFATYMPDVNWTLPEVNDQWDADALWWLETFGIDGLRIDAVKHVEDAATMNIATRIRRELEPAGTHVFLTGETAMGWSDCSLQCNEAAGQYSTISHYVGPMQLDGQFDFPLYYAVPANVFWSDAKGMIHADYWTQASGWEYGAGAIMSPYIGSQDTPRFTTLATYRGQDAQHGTSVPGNKWDSPAGPPNDSEPYARERVALAWLLTIPGAPMLYYGDEYGEWGGADPNNRPSWRGGATLSADEAANLAWTRKLGTARKELVALRRGRYVSIAATEDVLLFARVADGGETALVAITRASAPQTITATLPATLPLGEGAQLHDRLGGPDVVVNGGAVTITVGARSAAILAP